MTALSREQKIEEFILLYKDGAQGCVMDFASVQFIAQYLVEQRDLLWQREEETERLKTLLESTKYNLSGRLAAMIEERDKLQAHLAILAEAFEQEKQDSAAYKGDAVTLRAWCQIEGCTPSMMKSKCDILQQQQLATTQQHLETQQTATYQAVEREHELKRQLAAMTDKQDAARQHSLTKDGFCAYCDAYAATWLGDCTNPIHTQGLPEVIKLRAQLAAMTVERDEAYKLLYGARCIYCGVVVAEDCHNQDIGDLQFQAHIEICEKHPMTKAKQQLTASTKRCAELETALKIYAHELNWQLVATHDAAKTYWKWNGVRLKHPNSYAQHALTPTERPPT